MFQRNFARIFHLLWFLVEGHLPLVFSSTEWAFGDQCFFLGIQVAGVGTWLMSVRQERQGDVLPSGHLDGRAGSDV